MYNELLCIKKSFAVSFHLKKILINYAVRRGSFNRAVAPIYI